MSSPTGPQCVIEGEFVARMDALRSGWIDTIDLMLDTAYPDRAKTGRN